MSAFFRKTEDLEPVRFSDDLTAEVRRLKGEDRVAAVKLVRQRTGVGLAVAVRAVDAVE
jgi:hypothetical protein